MAHTLLLSQQRSNIIWLWKATADPYSSFESDEWQPYSDVEARIIEEAYARKESEALLDDYYIDLKHFVQVSNNNLKSQRPVKRVTNEREEARLREQRFMPNPIAPSTPFSDIYSGNFVKAVRDHFHLNDLRLTDDAERQLLIEKAVEGLIIEGKKVSRQKEAQWMARQLLHFQNGSHQEVWECCARLYCMESFLYIKMNEWMRLVDEKEQEGLWRSKLPTFGPFACLLYIPSGGDRQKKLYVYRGAQLSDSLIEYYRRKCRCSEERFLFPAFTSASRNRAKAEQFGNTLFVIELSEYDGYDVSPYSSYDEEEQLIKPSFSFYIRSCSFDKENQKWVICLKSYLSL